MKKITILEFENEMKKLEDKQYEFERIFTNKNWFIKFLNFKKARRLHEQIGKEMAELFSKEITLD